MVGTGVDLINKPQIIEHAHKSVTQTVYETRWIPSSARFVVLGSPPRGTGLMQIYTLSQGSVELLHEVRDRAGVQATRCVLTVSPSPSRGP